MPAVDLCRVADFLGLPAPDAPVLAPAALIDKLELVLAAAGRYTLQLPDDVVNRKVRDRDRTAGALAHHVPRLVEAFVEAAAGAELSEESLTAPAPEPLPSATDIVAYGESVRARLGAWWAGLTDKSCGGTIATYYGPQSTHALLERTAWHAAQHARQLMMVLEDQGIGPDRPLSDADLAGLPVPEAVWDDE